MVRKRNLISKLFLKYTNRAAYKDYKWDMVNYRQAEFTDFLKGANKLTSFNKIKAVADVNHEINFMHSGNAGDIIYAFPTLKKIHELTGAAINLYLRLGKTIKLPRYNAHPLGGVMMNQKMADMLMPLISTQDYINSCEVYAQQSINVDLDYIRAGVTPAKGNIARWCSYITGVSPDLWKQWLTVEPNSEFSDSIVIARSSRYQNTVIDFSFLNKYNNLIFLGVESEYKDIKRQIPKVKWIEVKDFRQMAQIIAGSKLFIGNQSFPYSIAEALKVPRILEVSFEVIDVIPEGPNGHDFFFQDHFEWLVENMAL